MKLYKKRLIKWLIPSFSIAVLFTVLILFSGCIINYGNVLDKLEVEVFIKECTKERSKNNLSKIKLLQYDIKDLLLQKKRYTTKSKNNTKIKYSKQVQSAIIEKIVHVAEKKEIPPGGTRNDYSSLSRYWWPNSITGKPYIHKDGRVNPEIYKYDFKRLTTFNRVLTILSKHVFLTGDKVAGDRAVKWLNAWFSNPLTRMKPNLKYAQRVPGICSGARWGIIESASLSKKLIDTVVLLKMAGFINNQLLKDIQDWSAEYCFWLLNSRFGKQEGNSKNNHGTWYDVQVSRFALLAGNNSVAKKHIEKYSAKRIDDQIKKDGSQPAELKRTKSYDYSIYNLNAWFILAEIAESLGIDLWNKKGKYNQGIQTALDYLVPFLLYPEKWRREQIYKIRPKSANKLLLTAYRKYGNKRYLKTYKSINGKK